jgi:hypothetical protein
MVRQSAIAGDWRPGDRQVFVDEQQNTANLIAPFSRIKPLRAVIIGSNKVAARGHAFRRSGAHQ